MSQAERISPDLLLDLFKGRRSIRHYRPDPVPDAAIDRILEAGRWAPSGANVQCWDFIAIDDPKMRESVRQVFFASGAAPRRSRERVSCGFEELPRKHRCDCNRAGRSALEGMLPAADFAGMGRGIPRQQRGHFPLLPRSSDPEHPAWGDSRGIDLRLAVGRWRRDDECRARRYRRPLGQVRHWNRYEPRQYRPHEQVDFYESTLRPFAMYRDRENLQDWPDFKGKLGDWADAFASDAPNPDGKLEAEADFSEPRTKGRATKARDRD
jgi:nitroreductase